MKKRCFVIMPFGEKYNRVYENAIKPAVKAVKEVDLECMRGDELGETHHVLGQVLEEIQRSSIVIADLSGDNVNVAYEVGFAQSIGKKTILISEQSERITHFNFRGQRIFFYDRSNEAGLKEELQKKIESETTSDDALLRVFLAPLGLSPDNNKYIIASNLLTHEARRYRGMPCNFEDLENYAENVGIIGLIRAFGLIRLDVLPYLINPGNYDVESLKKGEANIYLLGSGKANDWTGEALKELREDWTPKWEFRVDPQSRFLRDPEVQLFYDEIPYPAPKIGHEREKKDFGLIIRAPRRNHPNKIQMILAGRTGLGTAAACYAATTPFHINSISAKWNIDIGDITKPFWAIAIAQRQKGGIQFDRNSVEVVEARYFEPVDRQLFGFRNILGRIGFGRSS